MMFPKQYRKLLRIGPILLNSRNRSFFRKSFSLIQIGIARRNERSPRGAKDAYVSNSLSNFSKGLS
jgi:hypothetical protein